MHDECSHCLYGKEEYHAPRMRILIVEDNEKLGGYMKEMLEQGGYSVDTARDGEAGERMARASAYDLIVLDRLLPEKDGVAVCRSLRDDDIVIPIIMVTALGEVDQRIQGLDSGADDYLVKPFDMNELLARVRALLRRPQERLSEVLSLGDVTFDLASRTVRQGGRAVPMTAKELSVLEYFMRNKGRVVTRDDLLAHCWDFAYDPESNITDAYIKQIRKKLHDTNGKYITTVRGAGYTANG